MIIIIIATGTAVKMTHFAICFLNHSCLFILLLLLLLLHYCYYQLTVHSCREDTCGQFICFLNSNYLDKSQWLNDVLINSLEIDKNVSFASNKVEFFLDNSWIESFSVNLYFLPRMQVYLIVCLLWSYYSVECFLTLAMMRGYDLHKSTIKIVQR